MVSPGSVERALPGLEPDHDPLAEDVAAMLSPSRQQELALDLLDRAGAGSAERAVRQAREEIERAQQRIAAMREERANLGLLQRSRGAAVDGDIARQQEAVERGAARAATVSAPEAPARHEAPPIVADPHEARLILVARDETLGERPSSFAAREAWAREAVQLVGVGMPTLDPTIQHIGADDLGMDL